MGIVMTGGREMTREEFIKRSINETSHSISRAKAQLVVDGYKPRVSKSLIAFIGQCETKLLRLNASTLNEGEEFHLDNINS